MTRIAIVCTNTRKLGGSKIPTGWSLPEVAWPYYIFKKAGFDVIFVSPQGGNVPVDKLSVIAFKYDKECRRFLRDRDIRSQLKNTIKLSDLDLDSVDGIYFAGGRGAVFGMLLN